MITQETIDELKSIAEGKRREEQEMEERTVIVEFMDGDIRKYVPQSIKVEDILLILRCPEEIILPLCNIKQINPSKVWIGRW